MKKSIFKKLGGLFLGLAMGLGVAVGVAAGNKASEVRAEDKTAVIDLGSAVPTGSIADSLEQIWTYSYSGTADTKINSGEMRIGTGSGSKKGTASFTINVSSLGSTVDFSEITFYGKMKSGAGGFEKITINGVEYSTTPATTDGNKTIKLNNSTGVTSGNVVIEFGCTSKYIDIKNITLKYSVSNTPDAELTAVTKISDENVKKAYEVGDAFVSDGLVVYASWDGVQDTSTNIADKISWANEGVLTLEQTSITGYYKVDTEKSFPITISGLTVTAPVVADYTLDYNNSPTSGTDTSTTASGTGTVDNIDYGYRAFAKYTTSSTLEFNRASLSSTSDGSKAYLANTTAYPKNIKKIIVTITTDNAAKFTMYECESSKLVSGAKVITGSTAQKNSDYVVTYEFSDSVQYFDFQLSTTGTWVQIKSIEIFLGSDHVEPFVTNISINTPASVYDGKEIQLTAVVSYAGGKADDNRVTWKKVEDGKSTITNDGIFTARGTNPTKVKAISIAKDENGKSKEATVTITPLANPIVGVSIDTTNAQKIYLLNSTFSAKTSGVTAIATYQSGDSLDYELTDENFSGFDSSELNDEIEISVQIENFEPVKYTISIKQGYPLLMDDTNLVEGTVFYIANQNGTKTMSDLNGTYFNSQDTGMDANSGMIIPSENFLELHLEGNATNGWNIYYCSNGTKNYIGVSGQSVLVSTNLENEEKGSYNWSISISAGVATMTTANITEGNKMCYNTSSPRFRPYAGSAQQPIVSIYGVVPVLLNEEDIFECEESFDLNIEGSHSFESSVMYSENLTETLSVVSTNEEVATISNVSHDYKSGESTFTVNAIGNGETTIKVVGNSSKVELQQVLIVYTSLTELIVPQESISVGINQAYDLNNVITYNPTTTTKTEITWEISGGNTENANITEGGVFTAEVEGTYTVTLMDANTNIYDITVVATSPFVFDNLEASIPASKHYHLGDSFDTDNTIVIANYKNESGTNQPNEITGNKNISWDVPVDFATEIGKAYSIGLSFTDEDGVTQETNISVTLEQISKIEVISHDVEEKYLFGSSVGDNTISVKAYTASEQNGFIANNDYVEKSEVDSLKLGEQELIISYGEKTTTINTYVTNVNTSFYSPGLNYEASFANGKNNLPSGWSSSGLTSDYSSANKLKFDGTGDSIKLENEISTTASEIIITLECTNNGSGSFAFTANGLDVQGNVINGVIGTSTTYPAQNKSDDVVITIANNNNSLVCGVLITFTKNGSNAGVGSCTITAEGLEDTDMLNAQANAMSEYLAKFKTCMSGWNNRSEIENLVTEYNAMGAPAKATFDSLTLSDFNWHDAETYDVATHEYGQGSSKVDGIVAIDKLKDMVDYYNKSLQSGETQLVLHTSSGDFTTNSNRINPILALNNVDNSVWVISAVALVGLTAIGGYFFYRKRKEI